MAWKLMSHTQHKEAYKRGFWGLSVTPYRAPFTCRAAPALKLYFVGKELFNMQAKLNYLILLSTWHFPSVDGDNLTICICIKIK